MTYSSAVISPDGLYRYQLTRRWGSGPLLPWIMLNPSTADETIDDNTIVRVKNFSDGFGFGGCRIGNLYAFRSTDPKTLWQQPDPVGPDNNIHLHRILREAEDNKIPVVAAWGVNARQERIDELLAMRGASRLRCLGTTKFGAPKHPLYLPVTAQLEFWP
jgi:hypothetical protein